MYKSEVLVWCYTYGNRGVEDINKQDMAQQRLAHMLSSRASVYMNEWF